MIRIEFVILHSIVQIMKQLIGSVKMNQKANKYQRQIKSVQVDVYDVLKAWNVVNPALQHLIKKALQAGDRGHKSLNEDLDDIIASSIRAKELGQDAS